MIRTTTNPTTPAPESPPTSKTSGARLARWALEQLPVTHTMGIPGVHNTELYDELGLSEKIQPVLVTHEAGGAFMADAISRTSPVGAIGCLLIVPAAGVTHAMSGIAEAYLDGIPMLVLTGGVRTDLPFGHQLHQIDQQRLLVGVTKSFRRVEDHAGIVPAIFDAYRAAVSGKPGPAAVEIPVNLQLFRGDPGRLPSPPRLDSPPAPDGKLLEEAAELLAGARRPGIFVGWGAVDRAAEIAQIAELLAAPVATTLQGLSAFPADHPLHTGMGFGPAAVPAAENAFRDVDALLAVGTAFGEIPTGSYGCPVPEALVHVDIDPRVIGRNYPARVGIAADAAVAVPALLEELKSRVPDRARLRTDLQTRIAADKEAYQDQWLEHRADGVNPAVFLRELRSQLERDAILAVDDGNHTFLAAELYPVLEPRTFISPTDFNCMGYCVPAAIGAKLVNPARQVAGIVGDGALLMTGMEMLTASSHGTGVALFVFHDGELSQISQGQQIPYNRKTCTVLGDIRVEGIATATGARFLSLENDGQAGAVIAEALKTAEQGRPVLVDVRVDYSRRTRFTQGVVKTVLKRFPPGDKFRFIGRALWRKLRG